MKPCPRSASMICTTLPPCAWRLLQDVHHNVVSEMPGHASSNADTNGVPLNSRFRRRGVVAYERACAQRRAARRHCGERYRVELRQRSAGATVWFGGGKSDQSTPMRVASGGRWVFHGLANVALANLCFTHETHERWPAAPALWARGSRRRFSTLDHDMRRMGCLHAVAWQHRVTWEGRARDQRQTARYSLHIVPERLP